MRNVSAFQPNTASGTTKAYYPLNGNSRDYSGNTNTGTDTAITYPQGRFGQAAKFDSTTSRITNSSTLFNFERTNSFTLSSWVKNTSYSTSPYIIARLKSTANFTGYALQIDTGGKIIFYFGNDNGGSNLVYVNTTSQELYLNRFFNVVVTYDGSSSTSGIRIYVNGQSKALTSVFNNLTLSTLYTGDLNIGNREATNINFNGLIDEVIIESRAWTAKEIETYYRKSMLNYKQKTFGQMVWTYTSELLKGNYTLTGRNMSTFQNYVRQLLKGTYTLTGKQITANKSYVAQLAKGVYSLVGKILTVPNRWTNINKNNAVISNQSKNNASVSNVSKNNANVSNINKS